MSENIFFAALFFPAAACVLVFFMKYTSQILQARVRLGQDEAYRKIATAGAAAQVDNTIVLTDIQGRLAVIEKILRDVE